MSKIILYDMFCPKCDNSESLIYGNELLCNTRKCLACNYIYNNNGPIEAEKIQEFNTKFGVRK